MSTGTSKQGSPSKAEISIFSSTMGIVARNEQGQTPTHWPIVTVNEAVVVMVGYSADDKVTSKLCVPMSASSSVESEMFGHDAVRKVDVGERVRTMSQFKPYPVVSVIEDKS